MPLAASDRLPKQATPEDQIRVIESKKGDPDKFRDLLEKAVEDANPSDVLETVQLTRDIEAAANAIRVEALFALCLHVFPRGFEELTLDSRESFVASFRSFVSPRGSQSLHSPLISDFDGECPFELPWKSEIYPGIVAELSVNPVTIRPLVSDEDQAVKHHDSLVLRMSRTSS